MMASGGFTPPVLRTPTKEVPKTTKTFRVCMACNEPVISIGSGYFTKSYSVKGTSDSLEARVKRLVVRSGNDHELHADNMCKPCYRHLCKIETLQLKLQTEQPAFVTKYWNSWRKQHDTKVSLTRTKRMSSSPGLGTKKMDVTQSPKHSGRPRSVARSATTTRTGPGGKKSQMSSTCVKSLAKELLQEPGGTMKVG